MIFVDKKRNTFRRVTNHFIHLENYGLDTNIGEFRLFWHVTCSHSKSRVHLNGIRSVMSATSIELRVTSPIFIFCLLLHQFPPMSIRARFDLKTAYGVSPFISETSKICIRLLSRSVLHFVITLSHPPYLYEGWTLY